MVSILVHITRIDGAFNKAINEFENFARQGEVLEIRMISVACMLIPVREQCKKSFLILSDKEEYVCIF